MSWKVKMALATCSIANCITNMLQVQFSIPIYISLLSSVQGLQEKTVFIKGMSLN
jgi:hypothetical protein